MIFVDPATTNARQCLKVAGRLNVALRRELGQGIDAQRMCDEPLYARDVLLVCDALRSHAADGTSALAQQFRQAAHGVAQAASRQRDRAAAAAAGPRRTGWLDSGFSASHFFSSIFGPLSTRDATAPVVPARRQRTALPQARI